MFGPEWNLLLTINFDSVGNGFSLEMYSYDFFVDHRINVYVPSI